MANLAIMGLMLDPVKYGRLCAEVIPKRIESDEEFDRMTRIMETLDRKSNPTIEERTLSALLGMLIQEYDDRCHALPDVPPHQVIAHLMEQKGLRQADLLPVFGSRSVVSQVLSGKREPSKAHIRKLAEYFRISPAVFSESRVAPGRQTR